MSNSGSAPDPRAGLKGLLLREGEGIWEGKGGEEREGKTGEEGEGNGREGRGAEGREGRFPNILLHPQFSRNMPVTTPIRKNAL